jgi:hypothetical protein
MTSIPVVWYSDVRESDIKVNTPEWFTWLESVPSFSYQSADGKFTARKQRNYWNAYRKTNNILRQEYLATTANLTLDKLQDVAKLLDLSDLSYWSIRREKNKERERNSITVSNKAKSYKEVSTTDNDIAGAIAQANDEFKQKIEILSDTIKAWEVRVRDSCSRSGGRLPSERYKYVNQMVQELEECLSDSVENST